MRRGALTAGCNKTTTSAADVSFSAPEGGNAFIQVYSQSPCNGRVTYLASVGVTLVSGGPSTVVPARAHPEDIAITQPRPAQTVNGDPLHVQGVALASFEQALVVGLQDADGHVVASQPVMVAAPDLGQPGPLVADISDSLAACGPGRVVV